jgi:hypothetical protein
MSSGNGSGTDRVGMVSVVLMGELVSVLVADRSRSHALRGNVVAATAGKPAR